MNRSQGFQAGYPTDSTLAGIRRNHLLFSFPVIYLFAVSTVIYLIFSGWHYDDPYITYRYARNISQGQGYVYNPGERIQSTTTPLFTILLAVSSFFTSDLPRVANIIGAASLALGALLLWDLAHTWQTPEVGWTALLLYPTFTLPAAAIGSETPLYIAICLASFACFARKKYYLTAICAALAILARPDGVLVTLVLSIFFLIWKRNPIPWKSVFIFTTITLTWFLFSWAYFGNPLPVTLAAKQFQLLLPVSQSFFRGSAWILGWYTDGWQYWIEAILAAVGFFWMWRYARAWILVLTWTGLYFVSYSILHVSRYYWYYAPLVPGFIILVGLGIAAITHQAPKMLLRTQAGKTPSNGAPPSSTVEQRDSHARLGNILAFAILAPLTLAQVMDLWKTREQLEPRAAAYQAVGEWLEANTPPESVVSALEAGIIGYYSKRTMVDFAGLLQPEVANIIGQSETYDEAAIWAMQKFSPDYVVLVKGDLKALKQSYLEDRCKIAQQFPKEMFGFNDINIYSCR